MNMREGATVVVKVGSSSVTDPAGVISEAALTSVASQVGAVAAAGARPVLVSSGAIAAGRGAIRDRSLKSAIQDLQGLAAVGQGLLIERYTRLFAAHNLHVGQILFTGRDFGERTPYLNARQTIRRLMDWGVVPVVNENDTTATEEISLGDNDRLAALVAALIGADLLVILTDTAGIYSADPRLDTQASLIEEVASVDAALEAAAGGPGSRGARGGMVTKIAAAKLASWSGIPCVIAAATEADAIRRALAGESVGTRIRPRTPRLPARKSWIAFARPIRGRVLVDAGATAALLGGGGSLLPVGIAEVQGQFRSRDAIEVVDPNGVVIAKGLAAHSVSVLRSVAGRRGQLPPEMAGEAIHRDDMVLLATAIPQDVFNNSRTGGRVEPG